MCGRYTITVPYEQLLAFFDLNGETPLFHQYTPRYNAAPGQQLPAAVGSPQGPRIGLLRWGLVPAWASAGSPAAKPRFNAKSETVREKRSFREPLERRRCLLPADGFYEWGRRADGGKQPYRFTLKDGGLFVMAGLYDTWTSPEGHKQSGFTILTTSPNALMQPIHDRMPVILDRDEAEEWLTPSLSPPEAVKLLRPYPADRMARYPVHAKVGSVREDDESCIAPWTEQVAGSEADCGPAGQKRTDRERTDEPAQLRLF